MFTALALTILLTSTVSVGDDLAAANTRIEYYRARVAESPGLYPAYAQLAEAYLVRARLTLDPADVGGARAAAGQSLDLQSNYAGLIVMAAIGTFSHRFDESLAWLDRAAEVRPDDARLIAMRVEALLALGRTDDAAAVIESAPAGGEPEFHALAARGQWLIATGRWREASATYRRAADIALERDEPALAVAALARAAGACLDAGHPDEAAPMLDAAANLDPGTRIVRLHRAEYLEAMGDPADALAEYEALLQQVDDPVTRAGAFRLAKSLGAEERAEDHFRAAEAAFRMAIDAGEWYTLGYLARLYSEADVRLEEALALAKRNLAHTADRAARRLVADLEARLSADRVPGSPR